MNEIELLRAAVRANPQEQAPADMLADALMEFGALPGAAARAVERARLSATPERELSHAAGLMKTRTVTERLVRRHVRTRYRLGPHADLTCIVVATGYLMNPTGYSVYPAGYGHPLYTARIEARALIEVVHRHLDEVERLSL